MDSTFSPACVLYALVPSGNMGCTSTFYWQCHTIRHHSIFTAHQWHPNPRLWVLVVCSDGMGGERRAKWFAQAAKWWHCVPSKLTALPKKEWQMHDGCFPVISGRST
uniref:Uncharacterized protein n=1 Tax=Eutreptiella gymnastica TaxID=73025 RepID=A0A7S4D0Q3_9EUGL